MIIDAHHHLWDPKARDYPWMTGDALDPIRRSYTMDDIRKAAGRDVEATILVQAVSSAEETEEFLLAAQHSAGFIAGVVGWVDLTGDVPAEVARLRVVPGGRLLVGLRHQVENEPDADWLLRPDVHRGLVAIGSAGLVYDLQVSGPQRAAALAAVGKLPDVRFVIDHAGKPGIAAGEWEPWATWITDMSRLPNVTCKLSGLITEAPWDSWTAATIRPYAKNAPTWSRQPAVEGCR
jgi:L-fuconolactonase